MLRPGLPIGVVAPYAGQAELIRKMLDRPSVEVSSIDKFQGREKDIIIVTCVRSNANKRLGFLVDRRRFNVMLTRARSGFVLIGNTETLLTDDRSWRPWLEDARSKDLFTSEARLLG